MTKTAVDVVTGQILAIDSSLIESDVSDLASQISTLQGEVTTLQNNDDELGDQVQAIQAKVNDAALLNASENAFNGAVSVNNEFKIVGDQTAGETFSVSFAGGSAEIATNNCLDILSDTNFLTAPEVESTDTYEALSPNKLVTKKQVAEAIAEALAKLQNS